MRTLLALLLLASAAHGQIFAVAFKDEKATAKFKDRLVTVGNDQVLVGEGKFAIYLDDNTIKYDGNGKNELWVGDPADPAFVPYKYKNGERVAAGPKGVVEIPGKSIERVTILIREQSLAGLSEEYRQRMATIQELTTERDQAAKGTPEWFMAHQRLLSNYERLANWLSSTCFPVAAKKVEKELERQRKNVAADAIAERLTRAKSAIRQIEPDADLVAAAKAGFGDALTVKVQESLHLRVLYRSDITDERVRALLEFGEEVIDGFRGDCVDPYVGTDFEDKIPNKLFAEFCWGPTGFDEAEAFKKAYYRVEQKGNLEDRKRFQGSGFTRPLPPQSVHFWRYDETSDLEGQMAHNLGHDLTALHYSGSLTRPPHQDWLFEAVGFYVSLEFLGRNTVSCYEFKEAKYVHEKRKGVERTDQMGLRDFYNALALEAGPSIDKLALKELFDLEDPDMAKCWSFYDYVVKQLGKPGQQLLRAACETSKKKETFLQEWRTRCMQLFGLQGDALREIDNRWRAYAEAGQETGDGGRRK